MYYLKQSFFSLYFAHSLATVASRDISPCLYLVVTLDRKKGLPQSHVDISHSTAVREADWTRAGTKMIKMDAVVSKKEEQKMNLILFLSDYCAFFPLACFKYWRNETEWSESSYFEFPREFTQIQICGTWEISLISVRKPCEEDIFCLYAGCILLLPSISFDV